jgi:hypothetical protein
MTLLYVCDSRMSFTSFRNRFSAPDGAWLPMAMPFANVLQQTPQHRKRVTK